MSRAKGTLICDIETYSSVDLRKANVYAYSADPDFEIMMCAWRIHEEKGMETELAIGADEIRAIPGLLEPSWEVVAHNAPFERICFSRFFLHDPHQFMDPSRWIDTMAIAAENGYPSSLKMLAKALGAEDKDEAGTRLINTFCKPNRGKRILPADKPELWEEFKAYCIQDVDTLADVFERLPDWPHPDERRVWIVDQLINDRGIVADVDMAHAAIEADEKNRAIAVERMKELLGIENPGSVPQFTKAMAETGLRMDNLRAETVTNLLAGDDLHPVQREALELRQETALVASKKYQAVVASVSDDGRLRGQFKFFGAHTGRWSGRGVQLQNLPRASVDHPEAAILDLALGMGADSKTLKGLVRSLFVGPFTVADYSAIEARVLAWLAGEQWVLDAFAEGRDIYVETANRMSTPERPLGRPQGKIAVLALGYNGGINSLRNMGAAGTDEELQDLVLKYRKSVPRIKRLWSTIEEAFKYGGTAGRLSVEKDGRDRRLILPSGRPIIYHNVRRRDGRIVFDAPLGHVADTYGGRLAENATQAVSRDILAGALVKLEDKGYETVGHVHDEVIIANCTDVAAIESIITELPWWAKGLPLDAEGFTCNRYRKG